MKQIALTFFVIFGLVFILPAVNSLIDAGVSAGFTIDEEKRQNDKNDKGCFKKEATCHTYNLINTPASTVQLMAPALLHLPAPHIDPLSPPPNACFVG